MGSQILRISSSLSSRNFFNSPTRASLSRCLSTYKNNPSSQSCSSCLSSAPLEISFPHPTFRSISTTGSLKFFRLKTKRSLSSGVVAMAAAGSVQKSEEEWRAILSPEQFRILRQKGTEYPGTGEYDKCFNDGVYSCAGCGTPLYRSTTKFNSGCGWPAFYEGLPGAIKRNPDPDGMRIEITCAACGGHLGHVFKGEGFPTPTDERHCVNSVSLKFAPAN